MTLKLDLPPPSFRLLTYNVHSCLGTDRRRDPERIAQVIAEARPDIVCLQELDVGRKRSSHRDQAQEIAAHLSMNSYFHPALHIEGEEYGDAILTALPSRLVKAGGLPSIGEPRGAIWVEVMVEGRPVHIINTHLGLRGGERVAQAETLLGSDWLGAKALEEGNVVLAGDLNAVRRSAAFRILNTELSDATSFNNAGGKARPQPTFPSRFPVLRIDHILLGKSVAAQSTRVASNPLTRKASDHLPLLAELRLLDLE
ncbi:endonuclease/exonuclease/phosphatase family protein [Rhizobium paknamense]|uniref:Endonuclease/exonuclease/phosphatase family metal-dependent hydrolase n=1 Tax=Rhizobium paknamense TaxID=1206817 RepID=A0ABU0IEB8_9HYPH|nr:endonuclease/exonuclease/phosphatase family protein [Rhizobium paknamense]MDQ0455559.1 endonuclease/exonuclease/phosphatase family metal-dependent hydrolase [Rhizobium paknamense]